MTKETTIQRKLTARTMGLTQSEIKARIFEAARGQDGRVMDGTKVPLYTIGGVVRAYKLGQSAHGDWCQFIGDFAGFDVLNPDEIHRSPKCHVPEPMESMLRNAVDECFAAGSTPDISFSVVVHGLLDEKSATAYTFVIEPIHKIETNDEKVLALLPAANDLMPKSISKGKAKAELKA